MELENNINNKENHKKIYTKFIQIHSKTDGNDANNYNLFVNRLKLKLFAFQNIKYHLGFHYSYS